MSPATVDTLAILALHEQVYAALRGRAAPWFLRLLRRPEEVADFTDRGRRKMPALMCGADNNYLALTRRQIDTIRKAGEEALFAPPDIGLPPAPPVLAAASSPPAGLTPRNLSAQIHYAAAGNPVSSRPEAAVANCCPGLEVDFRAVWRRMFKGMVLREWDSLVVDVEPDAEPEIQELKGHRMLRVFLPGETEGIPVFTQFEGPASSDSEGKIVLTTNTNPAGSGTVGMVKRAGPCAQRAPWPSRELRIYPRCSVEPREGAATRSRIPSPIGSRFGRSLMAILQ